MKAAWIALAMMVACGAWADSQPPIPTPTKESSPVQKTTQTKRSATNKDQRGTEDRPLFVKVFGVPIVEVHGGPKADQKPAETANKENNGPALYRGYPADAWAALFTGALVFIGFVTGAFLICQSVLLLRQVNLARDEFRATHRPKISVRGFEIAFEGVTGDHMHPCSFTIFNEGSGTAFIRDVNVVLINGDSCWNQMNRRVQFRNPDTKARVLIPGQDEIYFTVKDFYWDRIDSNWFLVGFVRYSDRAAGGIERKIGFCRRWIRPGNTSGDIYKIGDIDIGAMRWVKEENEYEYSY
jgi:hypothetical protein